MFQSLDFWSVLTIVLIGLGTFVGSWALFRGNLSKTLKEFGDLSSTLGKALEDNKIDKDERAKLKKEYAEFIASVKELLKKKDSR